METKPEVDDVNHPPHYKMGEFEVIEIIEDQKLNYNLGNALKYICRSRHKGNFKRDLKKAIWYLQRELEGFGERQG